MVDSEVRVWEIVQLLSLLTKIADELRDDPKYAPVVKWIERWHDGSSQYH